MYIYVYIYIYIYIYIYNIYNIMRIYQLPVNAIVRLSHRLLKAPSLPINTKAKGIEP